MNANVNGLPPHGPHLNGAHPRGNESPLPAVNGRNAANAVGPVGTGLPAIAQPLGKGPPSLKSVSDQLGNAANKIKSVKREEVEKILLKIGKAALCIPAGILLVFPGAIIVQHLYLLGLVLGLPFVSTMPVLEKMLHAYLDLFEHMGDWILDKKSSTDSDSKMTISDQSANPAQNTDITTSVRMARANSLPNVIQVVKNEEAEEEKRKLEKAAHQRHNTL